jgi:acetyltransferase-like isoleucine patch superfamily enzyme
MKQFIFFIGLICSYVMPYKYFQKWHFFKTFFYSGWISNQFKFCGKSPMIYPFRALKGSQFISIGDNVYLGKGITLAAWDKYNDEVYKPQVVIGNGCSIGDDSHITSINGIQIGNNVLTGKKVLITDNSHGEALLKYLDIEPLKRTLYSKGPVIIGDNTWIGEKVSILPGVQIGRGCIIAANSVVTKNIPSFSVAAGMPAIVIKNMNC